MFNNYTEECCIINYIINNNNVTLKELSKKFNKSDYEINFDLFEISREILDPNDTSDLVFKLVKIVIILYATQYELTEIIIQ